MKLHFRAFGEGPPLLILHGLLGSLDNWVPHAQLLAKHFQVFTLDLRNHGQSPHANEFNYEAMAGDLGEFLNDQKLEVVHLLGHSLGGKTAMRFAQLYPDSVQRLVVVDISPGEQRPRYDGVMAAMHGLDLSRFQRRDEVDAVLATAAPEKKIRQFLLKNVGRNETGNLRWKPNLASLRENYARVRSALPATDVFHGPTLFVRGGTSDYVNDTDLGLIRQLFPLATLHAISDAGHWVHAEAPEEFLEVVTGFLLAKK